MNNVARQLCRRLTSQERHLIQTWLTEVPQPVTLQQWLSHRLPLVALVFALEGDPASLRRECIDEAVAHEMRVRPMRKRRRYDILSAYCLFRGIGGVDAGEIDASLSRLAAHAAAPSAPAPDPSPTQST